VSATGPELLLAVGLSKETVPFSTTAVLVFTFEWAASRQPTAKASHVHHG